MTTFGHHLNHLPPLLARRTPLHLKHFTRTILLNSTVAHAFPADSNIGKIMLNEHEHGTWSGACTLNNNSFLNFGFIQQRKLANNKFSIVYSRAQTYRKLWQHHTRPTSYLLPKVLVRDLLEPLRAVVPEEPAVPSALGHLGWGVGTFMRSSVDILLCPRRDLMLKIERAILCRMIQPAVAYPRQ